MIRQAAFGISLMMALAAAALWVVSERGRCEVGFETRLVKTKVTIIAVAGDATIHTAPPTVATSWSGIGAKGHYSFTPFGEHRGKSVRPWWKPIGFQFGHLWTRTDCKLGGIFAIAILWPLARLRKRMFHRDSQLVDL